MCKPVQRMLKRGITAQVTPPNDSGFYTGNTNSLKATYKQKFKLYEEYEEHKQNKIKVIQVCFDEDLLINLKSDGMLLRVTPMQVY